MDKILNHAWGKSGDLSWEYHTKHVYGLSWRREARVSMGNPTTFSFSVFFLLLYPPSLVVFSTELIGWACLLLVIGTKPCL